MPYETSWRAHLIAAMAFSLGAAFALPSAAQDRYTAADWDGTQWRGMHEACCWSGLSFTDFDGTMEVTGTLGWPTAGTHGMGHCAAVSFSSDYTRFMVRYEGCGNPAFNGARVVCRRESSTTLRCTTTLHADPIILTKQ